MSALKALHFSTGFYTVLQISDARSTKCLYIVVFLPLLQYNILIFSSREFVEHVNAKIYTPCSVISIFSTKSSADSQYLCSMSQFTLSITLPPYLAQWFIHKQGGTQPVELTRDQPETDILRRFLLPQPLEPPKRDPSANVTIYIPTFRCKDVRQYNYLSPAGVELLAETIRNDFIVDLWNVLHNHKALHIQLKDMIDAFMEDNGIEYNDTNWCAIQQIYNRKRKANEKATLRSKLASHSSKPKKKSKKSSRL